MLIDSHAHLDMNPFDQDRAEVIERAVKGGVTRIVTVGIDLDSSLSALRLCRENNSIYASVGYHPHSADECTPEGLDKLAGIALEPKIVAWGEIGLDFYRRYSPPEKQLKMFLRQLEIANDIDMPVIIHDRDAHMDVLTILKKMGKGKRRGVIHCFSGDTDLALALIELGYFISIPGTVTYPKASEIKAVASTIPLECLIVETDAPFLAPVPKRGKRNEPLFVTYTAREIARLRNMDFEKLARQTTENAKILFGWNTS